MKVYSNDLSIMTKLRKEGKSLEGAKNVLMKDVKVVYTDGVTKAGNEVRRYRLAVVSTKSTDKDGNATRMSKVIGKKDLDMYEKAFGKATRVEAKAKPVSKRGPRKSCAEVGAAAEEACESKRSAAAEKKSAKKSSPVKVASPVKKTKATKKTAKKTKATKKSTKGKK